MTQKDIGQFPIRRMPISHRRPISKATQISLEDIFKQLTSLNMAVYAPMSYIFPSAMEKYEDLFDTVVNNNSRFKQVDREKSLQSLMTVNLLKRLESSVHSFRLTLNVLKDKIENALKQIASFEQKQLMMTLFLMIIVKMSLTMMNTSVRL